MKKVINNIKRNHSVVSYKENLERLYTFKNFPIFMGCTDEPSKDDMFSLWFKDEETDLWMSETDCCWLASAINLPI